MPTTYTHNCFGREVLRQLPQALQERIAPHRSIYNFGLHGPDLFFYFDPFRKNPIGALGVSMHSDSGATALRRLRALDDGSDESFAYLAGFLCHFALDSACHRYIDDMKALGAGHAQLEAELDRSFLLADGLDPLTHDPCAHLHPSSEAARAIARFFPQLTEPVMEKVLRRMVLYLRLLTPESRPKRALLNGAFTLLHAHDSFGGLVLEPHAVPLCKPMVARLRAMFDEAVPLAVRLILAYPDLSDPQYQLTFNGLVPVEEGAL